jgi:hypothetical protein
MKMVMADMAEEQLMDLHAILAMLHAEVQEYWSVNAINHLQIMD